VEPRDKLFRFGRDGFGEREREGNIVRVPSSEPLVVIVVVNIARPCPPTRLLRVSAQRQDSDSIISETRGGKGRKEINLGSLGVDENGARELRCALIRFSSRARTACGNGGGTDGFITAISHFVRLLRQRTLFVSNVETWRGFTGFNGAATQERGGGNSNNIRRGR